jgi:hypothetical protein
MGDASAVAARRIVPPGAVGNYLRTRLYQAIYPEMINAGQLVANQYLIYGSAATPQTVSNRYQLVAWTCDPGLDV